MLLDVLFVKVISGHKTLIESIQFLNLGAEVLNVKNQSLEFLQQDLKKIIKIWNICLILQILGINRSFRDYFISMAKKTRIIKDKKPDKNAKKKKKT